MGFLLIKILALLGLAAACGAGAAYWWFRRHYEDVTLEYARTREEWDAWRRNFEERLGSRPAVNLEPRRAAAGRRAGGGGRHRDPGAGGPDTAARTPRGADASRGRAAHSGTARPEFHRSAPDRDRARALPGADTPG